ncbi:MAG TPA: RluA family pseudouridine synthase [Bacilli bacterium]|nr:RluA family pseudouridine synthase [Bacilli bacterium]
MVNKYIVDTGGSRIDKYLIKVTDLSRNKVQELINADLVKVNNRPVKSSYTVKENDSIEIEKFLENETDIVPEDIKLDIIYEDNDVIVVNKPSGMVVHPAAGNYSNTLVNALLYHTNSLSDINGNIRPGIIHRIDKDTSGLLLVAKNNNAHKLLAKELEERKIKRVYVALVDGIINNDSGTIDAPIGRSKVNRKKMEVTADNSKEAVTHFKVLKRLNGVTLIECTLDTGRTHQIRAHMKYIGYPIVNDPVYNNKKATSFGQMLHAKRISFVHPITNKLMEFECDIPNEFKEILNSYI